MSKIEKAISQMEAWADDDTHGYDQTYRWGQKGDYDCSAAVIQAWENAGVSVKSKGGATYTGNMLAAFKKCGFSDVTKSINLSTGAGLIRGDVLLNVRNHTAMYCGNGYEVEASINEKGGITGGIPGDQTGREFLKRTYRNYPWDYVLRYTEDGSSVSVNTSAHVNNSNQKAEGMLCEVKLNLLKKGSSGAQVKALQLLLIGQGYKCGAWGADGDFGSATYNAVIKFQKAKGIDVDGIVGENTWGKLLKG